MRHLLLVSAMFVFGLAITFGTASVLQDVAVTRGKGAHGDWSESNQRPKPMMKTSTQRGSLAADASIDSHL